MSFLSIANSFVRDKVYLLTYLLTYLPDFYIWGTESLVCCPFYVLQGLTEEKNG